jgi:D-alanyl-D-alanine carboxypeptidase/D-alanyl-D-alanine-endopeptidase (penicillin-binding protein 4)
VPIRPKADTVQVMNRNRAPILPILGLLLAGLVPVAGRTAPAGPGVPAAAAADAALRARIRAFLQAPRFAAAAWGIQVTSLDDGRVVFEHQAGRYFTPASTTKLFTAALALERLGPDRRLRTSLYGSAPPGPDGVLAGDLVLYGRGDPALANPWMDGPFRTDPLEAMAARLKARGTWWATTATSPPPRTGPAGNGRTWATPSAPSPPP